MTANATVEGGLRLFRDKQNAGIEKCIALAGDSTVIGVGDPVKISAAGATQLGAGENVMAVTRAAGTTDSCYGVCVGVAPIIEGTGTQTYLKYRAASTLQYIYVRPANNQDIYTIQDDGLGSLSIANIGNNAQLTAANCDTTTGMSKFVINSSNVNSGNATWFVHIMGVLDDPNNNVSNQAIRWLVTLNNITRSGGTGVAGT